MMTELNIGQSKWRVDETWGFTAESVKADLLEARDLRSEGSLPESASMLHELLVRDFERLRRTDEEMSSFLKAVAGGKDEVRQIKYTSAQTKAERDNVEREIDAVIRVSTRESLRDFETVSGKREVIRNEFSEALDGYGIFLARWFSRSLQDAFRNGDLGVYRHDRDIAEWHIMAGSKKESQEAKKTAAMYAGITDNDNSHQPGLNEEVCTFFPDENAPRTVDTSFRQRWNLRSVLFAREANGELGAGRSAVILAGAVPRQLRRRVKVHSGRIAKQTGNGKNSLAWRRFSYTYLYDFILDKKIPSSSDDEAPMLLRARRLLRGSARSIQSNGRVSILVGLGVATAFSGLVSLPTNDAQILDTTQQRQVLENKGALGELRRDTHYLAERLDNLSRDLQERKTNPASPIPEQLHVDQATPDMLPAENKRALSELRKNTHYLAERLDNLSRDLQERKTNPASSIPEQLHVDPSVENNTASRSTLVEHTGPPIKVTQPPSSSKRPNHEPNDLTELAELLRPSLSKHIGPFVPGNTSGRATHVAFTNWLILESFREEYRRHGRIYDADRRHSSLDFESLLAKQIPSNKSRDELLTEFRPTLSQFAIAPKNPAKFLKFSRLSESDQQVVVFCDLVCFADISGDRKDELMGRMNGGFVLYSKWLKYIQVFHAENGMSGNFEADYKAFEAALRNIGYEAFSERWHDIIREDRRVAICEMLCRLLETK